MSHAFALPTSAGMCGIIPSWFSLCCSPLQFFFAQLPLRRPRLLDSVRCCVSHTHRRIRSTVFSFGAFDLLVLRLACKPPCWLVLMSPAQGGIEPPAPTTKSRRPPGWLYQPFLLWTFVWPLHTAIVLTRTVSEPLCCFVAASPWLGLPGHQQQLV